MADMNALAQLLAAEFEKQDVLSFEGRGGRTFDYIEDETVMDRSDEVLGIGATSWGFTVVTDVCVRGALDVRWPDGTTSHYEDFGYATRADSAEPLKEAVSDCIRRLGRYIGIFRYGYHKHSSQGTGRAGPSSPARPAAPPRSSTSVPDEPDWLEPTSIGTKVLPAQADNSDCPIHGVTWNGQFGDLWHKTEEGAYCRHPDNVKRERAAARR